MDKTRLDVVGYGNPVMDLVVNVGKMPPLDGFTGANEIFYQGGGKVATAMVAVARLGCRAGMLARVGGGPTGDFVIGDLAYNGVEVSHIVRGEKGSTSPFCLSLSEEESKTRIFIGKGKTAATIPPEELDLEYIGGARCLLLESGDPTSAAAARYAKENGITVVMDADAYHPEVEALIPSIDVFIASEYYFTTRHGGEDCHKVCREIAAQGPSTVIFTFGSRGCKGISENGPFEQPCFAVKVHDTTGAGDVFHGAYIVAMLEGKTAVECAKFASAVSAIKCTCIGGRTGIPNRATVDRFMATGEIDSAELNERLRYYRSNL